MGGPINCPLCLSDDSTVLCGEKRIGITMYDAFHCDDCDRSFFVEQAK